MATIPAPRQPTDLALSTGQPHRVRVSGDLFHGRVPEGAVYVGRGAPGLAASRYANPHRVGQCRICGTHHDQSDAVAAYARYLDDRPDLVAAARRELAGVDLACWCRLDAPCHADVLLDRLARPRVWLVAGLGNTPTPVDQPPVRDSLMRRWEHGPDGRYHTTDGRHHASWAELHARFDLVEVIGHEVRAQDSAFVPQLGSADSTGGGRL